MPDNPIAGLYPQPPPPPQQSSNVLNNLPAFAGLISAANQNALFQKEFAAKQAIGRAAQNALNPDGSVDFQRYSSGLKDPAAAYGAQDAVGSLLGQRGQQIANSKTQFELSAGQSGAIVNTLGSLADNNNLTLDDVRHTAVTLARTSNIPSPIINGWLKSLPSDPAALRQSLLNLRNAAIGSAGVSGRVAGPASPQGAPSTMSLGQANQFGAGAAPEPAPGPVAPQAATAPSPYGSLAASAAAPAPSRLIYSALPPGQAGSVSAAGSATGAASAGQGIALQSAADNAPNRKSAIANLGKDLDQFESGPLAGAVNTGKAVINQGLGLAGQKPFFDPNSIAAKESFDKIATTLADQGSALGGTDARLTAAIHSNPSSLLSRPGNRLVMQVLNGNEDAIAVKNKAWQQYKSVHGPDSYGEFSTSFNENFEPRAFQLPYMTPAERQSMLANMTPAEQKQVLTAAHIAVQRGWIKAPNAK